MESEHTEEKHTIAYENQRWMPLIGWISVYLPTDVYNFSDECGTKELNKSDYIDNNNSWEYATNFQSSFDPICGILSCVRRKKWDIKLSPPNIPSMNDISSDTIDVAPKDDVQNIILSNVIDKTKNSDENSIQLKRKRHRQNRKRNKHKME